LTNNDKKIDELSYDHQSPNMHSILLHQNTMPISYNNEQNQSLQSLSTHISKDKNPDNKENNAIIYPNKNDDEIENEDENENDNENIKRKKRDKIISMLLSTHDSEAVEKYLRNPQAFTSIIDEEIANNNDISDENIDWNSLLNKIMEHIENNNQKNEIENENEIDNKNNDNIEKDDFMNVGFDNDDNYNEDNVNYDYDQNDLHQTPELRDSQENENEDPDENPEWFQDEENFSQDFKFQALDKEKEKNTFSTTW